MWLVETVLIGHVSHEALAGVGMASLLVVVTFIILLTFIVGCTLVVNQHLGAGDKEWADHFLGQTVILAVLAGLVVGGVWYFVAPIMFHHILGAVGPVARNGTEYLRTLSLFALPLTINFIALGVVRGAGDTRYSMMINLTMNGVNLVLAPILIFGLFGMPRLEIVGAALAAGVSHTIAFAVTLSLLSTRKMTLSLRHRDLKKPNFGSVRKLFALGVPTTVEQLLWTAGQLVLFRYANTIGKMNHPAVLMAVAAPAAHAAIIRLQGVLSMAYQGVGLSAMMFVGRRVGEGDRKGAERVYQHALLVVSGFALLFAIYLWVWSEPVMRIFTTEPSVISLGARVLKVVAILQIPRAMGVVNSSALRGAGDIKWLMWMMMWAVLVLEIGLGWALGIGAGLGLVGLWIATASDEAVRAALSLGRFKKGKWKSYKPGEMLGLSLGTVERIG
jgi:putative MATE family efflux protein